MAVRVIVRIRETSALRFGDVGVQVERLDAEELEEEEDGVGECACEG